MKKLNELKIHELRNMLDNKSISPEEIMRDVVSCIDTSEKNLHAFVKCDKNGLIRSKKPNGPLSGIPIAIKDNMCIEGVETTCSSRILEGFIPPYTATAVQKLIDAGAILVPRANMDEFAMGSSTETSAFGPTRNPHNLEYVPGGSSGGSAVSVAGNEVIASLGSDTGGSIRQPAALCGVVGMKPTYGRVSRYGLIAFASSLDQIGPITKDITDCAILMNVISGYDPSDSTSANVPVPDFMKVLGQSVKGMKIGIPREYFIDGMDKEVSAAIQNAIKILQGQGAEMVDINLPHTEYAVAAYYILATAEASSNLARYDGVQYGHRTKEPASLIDMYFRTREEGFGPEVKRRIILGTYVLSAGYYDAYYLKALKVRTLISKDFSDAFKKVDVILTPTSPTPAFKIGERAEDPLQMYLSDIYTISVNLAGLPAVSLPCGKTKNKLPIGLQLIGKPFDEETIIKVGSAFEEATKE